MLHCFELSDSVYAAEDLAALSGLTSLTRLLLWRVDKLPPLEALTALAGSLRVLEIHSWVGDGALLDGCAAALTGLQTLALDFGGWPNTHLWLPPAALAAQLPRLRSLALTSYAVTGAESDEGRWPGALPACAPSLRWLALPLELALPSLAALAHAQQLETLCVLLPSNSLSFDAGQWAAFWQFVATHPPLRRFVYEVPATSLANNFMLLDALLLLQRRRPALQVQRLLSPADRVLSTPACWAELAA